MKTKDLALLKFIYVRLINVHKENENCDYMINFKNLLFDYEKENLIDNMKIKVANSFKGHNKKIKELKDKVKKIRR